MNQAQIALSRFILFCNFAADSQQLNKEHAVDERERECIPQFHPIDFRIRPMNTRWRAGVKLNITLAGFAPLRPSLQKEKSNNQTNRREDSPG